MKKLITIIFLIAFVIGLCFIVWNIAKNHVLNNIQVDAVDEVAKGIVTIKIDGQYFDYAYEYVEGFKTYEERQAEK